MASSIGKLAASATVRAVKRKFPPRAALVLVRHFRLWPYKIRHGPYRDTHKLHVTPNVRSSKTVLLDKVQN